MSDHATETTGRTRSRRKVLRDALVGALAAGAGVEALAHAPSSAGAQARGSAEDARILGFLLELERLQASFFGRAAGDKRLRSELRQFASVTAKQDDAHAQALQSMLGSAAAPTELQLARQPQNDAEFLRDALDVKESAVAAYVGEAANLSVAKMTRVASIVSVDARHAAWIRSIADTIPAPRASDRAETAQAVIRALEGSGVARRK